MQHVHIRSYAANTKEDTVQLNACIYGDNPLPQKGGSQYVADVRDWEGAIYGPLLTLLSLMQ